MSKRSFSSAERYAVWSVHQMRCWLCMEPLRLIDTTVDHVIPERLLQDERQLREVLDAYGLPATFAVNGFENWLPAHSSCNQRKGGGSEFVPGYAQILGRLQSRASEVEAVVKRVSEEITKDRVFAPLLTALEKDRVRLVDLEELVLRLGGTLPRAGSDIASHDFIRLDNGYWIHQTEIAEEGPCQCERATCVESSRKVHCYWSMALPEWVIAKRLYRKCYDEVISCSLCGAPHKRGHVGWQQVCVQPGLPQRT